MKKLLLIIPALAFGFFIQQIKGQPCTLGNPGVKLNYTIPEGANCRIGLDLYFDLKHNPGGKYFWVHIWPTASYSNWNYASPPTTGNGGLTGSIATFGVEHQGTSLVMNPSYPPDNIAPGFQYSGLTAAEGLGIMPDAERYTIKNLQLIVPGGCTVSQSFTADVWESQSAQSQNVHCFIKGMNFYANDPTATGLLYCNSPRQYNFSIRTISATDMTVSYKVYIDDGDGIFNVATDNILVNSGSAVLDASNLFRYQSPILGYLPYSAQKPYADRDLWVEITTIAAPNAVYAQLVNSCIPLPARLSFFTAARNKEVVELRWETASERNCKGFYIERLSGTSVWEPVTFTPSRAASGNSEATLVYNYTDFNVSKGVSQYRLRQVDIDNKAAYSEIRLVKGLGQANKLVVYPNPCRDGQITVVSDFNIKDLTIRLIDMNGRLLKEWLNPATNNLNLSQVLKSGVYILQVWNKQTGEKEQTKIVISK